jgi:ankyrin repeat protein
MVNSEDETFKKLNLTITSMNDIQKQEALFKSITDGHLNVLKFLIEHGANVNGLNMDKLTSLSVAIFSTRHNFEIVKILIDNGADVNKPDDDTYEYTPLCSAVDSGHLEIVKLLIENGADVNKPDGDGWIPLHSATHNQYLEIMKLLLDNGSDINRLDNDGWTPLFIASGRGGGTEAVKLLLEYGADSNKPDNNGYMAFEKAIDRRSYKIVKLFIKHDFDLNDVKEQGSESKKIKRLTDIIRSGWMIENHKYFSTIKQQKIETFIKLHFISWISKIPKPLIFNICKAMSLQ